LRLAVASGKGGTGKTTLAVGIGIALAAGGRNKVSLLDCDVEQPNDHLFLSPTGVERRPVEVGVPLIDESACTGCGECAEACRFNALAVVGGRLLSFPELCHGCGACWITCKTGGIARGTRRIGWTLAGRSAARWGSLSLVWGELDPGQPLAPPIIRQVKELGLAHREETRVEILDAPPGTSCPLVEAVEGVDACLLVTEPTPFGLHDLELAAEVLRIMNIPSGVVVNREGVGDSAPILRFSEARGLPVLMKIPFSRRIAEVVAAGGTLLDVDSSWQPALVDLWDACQGLARDGGRPRAGDH